MYIKQYFIENIVVFKKKKIIQKIIQKLTKMRTKCKKPRIQGGNPKTPKFSTIINSGNRFQALSVMKDDISSTEDYVKIPPIIVDNCHSFTEIIKLLEFGCKYKRMSIGINVMPNTLTVNLM